MDRTIKDIIQYSRMKSKTALSRSPRRLLVRFLLTFVPMAVVISIATYPVLRDHDAGKQEALINIEHNFLLLTDLLIRKEFLNIFDNIGSLGNLPSLRKYLSNPDDESRSQLTNFFTIFAEETGGYDQIVLLDKNGTELIRVDYRDGKAHLVPEHKLESSKDRYFFLEANRLPKEGRYISEIELKQESGTLIIPLKPIIHLAMPVLDSTEKHQGVIVFNYLGKVLIDQVRSLMASSDLGWGMLLNSEGNLLISHFPENEWGNLAERNGNSFDSLYPDVWQAMSTADEGQLEADEGVFLFNRIDPLQDVNGFVHTSTAQTSVNRSAHEYTWRAVRFIPNSILKEGSILGSSVGWYGALFTYLLLAAIAWFSAYHTIRTKHHIEQLAGRERRFRSMIDSSPIPYAQLDIEQNVVYLNPAFSEQLGYKKSDIPTMDDWWTKACPDPKYRSRITRAWRARLQRAMRNNEPVRSVEAEIYCKDGRILSMIGQAAILRDEYEQLALLVSFYDVTPLKELEEKIDSERQFLQTLTDTLAEGVFVLDNNGICTYVNSETERLLGWKKDELEGKSWHDQVHHHLPDNTPVSRSDCQMAIALHQEGFYRNDRESFIQRNGTHIPVSVNARPFKRDKTEWVVGSFNDVTKQAEIEKILIEAKENAIRESRSKSAFLANMSHEIRTPLNSIIGQAYLLERSSLDNDQKEQLSSISSASRILLGLINDILDLSKIEAGEIQIENQPFELRYLLDEMRGMFRVLAANKQLVLDIPEPAADLPPMLEGDSMRLSQMLANLLSNSIKFTSEGGVRLDVRLVGINPSGSEVVLRFAVKDTGIGISPEGQERLFKPFSQADSSVTRRFGGTGLGLSIVRQLAEQMGGKAGLESVEGKGSTFWLELPLTISSMSVKHDISGALVDTAAETENLFNLPGVHVLVVDDSEMNLDVCQRILQHEGATSDVCESGQCALEKLRQSPDSYDVVLMDMQMPEMDGIETTMRIRGELELTELPVIALTASVLASERKRALNSGMDDFLTKPLEPARLNRVIRKHVEAVRGEPVALIPREPREESVTDWPEISGINMEEVQQRFQGDQEMFISLLRPTIKEADEIVAGLRLLVNEERAADAAPDLHKLRGLAGNIGMTQIGESSLKLERVVLEQEPGTEPQLLEFIEVCEKQLQVIHNWLESEG